jgi:hypothetical protein
VVYGNSTVNTNKFPAKIVFFSEEVYFSCFSLGKVLGSIIKGNIKYNGGRISVHIAFLIFIVQVIQIEKNFEKEQGTSGPRLSNVSLPQLLYLPAFSQSSYSSP